MPRRIATTLVALLALVVLSACGSSKNSSNGVVSKSADQIIRLATTAATGAESAHVFGSINDDDETIELDLQLAAGERASGQMTVSGASVRLIRIHADIYMNGSDAFWKKYAGAGAASLLTGVWLKVPATGKDFASFAAFTDLNEFFKQSLSDHGKLVKGKETTVAGQKVIAIRDTTEGGTLYVATTGEPYPVKLIGEGSDGIISFDRWNEKATVKAPSGAIDVRNLE